MDKYIGDAIMAFRGIPFDKEDSPRSSIEAALSVQIGLALFNSTQLTQGGVLPSIGISSGPVVAGYIGSTYRAEYTVLGYSVNAAQRIESCASATQVLISASTPAQLEGRTYGLKMPPLAVKKMRARGACSFYATLAVTVDTDDRPNAIRELFSDNPLGQSIAAQTHLCMQDPTRTDQEIRSKLHIVNSLQSDITPLNYMKSF